MPADAMQTVQLSIPQLDTGSVAVDLGAVLVGLSGVAKVSMDQERHTVSVQYDPHFVSEALIREIVKNAGYPGPEA